LQTITGAETPYNPQQLTTWVVLEDIVEVFIVEVFIVEVFIVAPCGARLGDDTECFVAVDSIVWVFVVVLACVVTAGTTFGAHIFVGACCGTIGVAVDIITPFPTTKCHCTALQAEHHLKCKHEISQ
jgi:hypothetical protein